MDLSMRQVVHEARRKRAAECPVVGDLPDYPGIIAAMMISPTLAGPLRGLADALLVKPFDGVTVSRAERELIATAVSAGNDCFYCMDTHGAYASELLQQERSLTIENADALVDELKSGHDDDLPEKMRKLIKIALLVRERARGLDSNSVRTALAAGATNQDVQLAILIAAAFCMYNRIVDGFRAPTPTDVTGHRARAKQIAEYGYIDPRVTAIPASAAQSGA